MIHFFAPSAYYRPESLGEAVELLSKHRSKARLIAGGTDLLVTKPPGVETLIDVGGLNLSYLKEEQGTIRIGAGTAVDLVEHSPLLADWPYQVLAEAARSMATPTIRNMATIGGNVCNGSPAADLSLGSDGAGRVRETRGPQGWQDPVSQRIPRGVDPDGSR